MIASARLQLGFLEAVERNPVGAITHFKNALKHYGETESYSDIAEVVISIASLAAPRDAMSTATLLGAAAELIERTRMILPPYHRSAFDSSAAVARGILGDAAFEMAWAAGQAMDPEQAAAEGLRVAPSRALRRRRPAST